jgi:gliding motility-associated-like protein
MRYLSFLFLALGLSVSVLGSRAYAQDNYNLTAELSRQVGNRVWIDVSIERTSGANFYLGPSNFVLRIDPNVLDLSGVNFGIETQGVFSAAAAGHYQDVLLGTNPARNILNLTVSPEPGITNAAPVVDGTKQRIARIFATVKATACTDNINLEWETTTGNITSITAFPLVISPIGLANIKPNANFVDPVSIFAGARITPAAALDPFYCAGTTGIVLNGNAAGDWTILSGSTVGQLAGTLLASNQVTLNLNAAAITSSQTVQVRFTLGSCTDVLEVDVLPNPPLSLNAPYGATTVAAPYIACDGTRITLVANRPVNWTLPADNVTAITTTNNASTLTVEFDATVASGVKTITLQDPAACGGSTTFYFEARPVVDIVGVDQACGATSEDFTVAAASNWRIISPAIGTASVFAGTGTGTQNGVTDVTVNFGPTPADRVDTLIATANGCSDTLLITVLAFQPIQDFNNATVGGICPESGPYLLSTGVAGTDWSFAANNSGGYFNTPATFDVVDQPAVLYYPGQNITIADLTDQVQAITPGLCVDLFDITVRPQPSVSVAPLNPAAVCAGQWVELTATLNAGGGAAPAYQWLLNGGTIAGATNDTYRATQTGDYSVRVTNTDAGNGCSSTTTPAVSVTVNPLPRIDLAGPVTVVIPNAGTTRRTYTATNPDGAGLDWQRRKGNAAPEALNDADPAAAGFQIDFGLPPVSSANFRDTIVVRATSLDGCVNTDTVFVNLNLCDAVVGNYVPASSTANVCIGNTATVVIDDFVGEKLYWMQSTTTTNFVGTVNLTTNPPTIAGDANWQFIDEGAQSATLITLPLTALGTYYYRAVAGDLNGTCTDVSNASFALTVGPAPERGLTVGSGDYCQGTTASLLYTGTLSTGTTITWQTSADGTSGWTAATGGGAYPNNGTVVNNTAAGTSTYTTGAITADAYFRVLIQEVCSTAIGDVVFVARAPVPVATMANTAITLCEGSTTPALGGTLTAGNGFWLDSPYGDFSAEADPNATFTTDVGVIAGSQQTVTLYYLVTSGSCDALLLERQITIDHTSEGTFATAPAPICGGGSTGSLGVTAIHGTGVWTDVSPGAAGTFVTTNPIYAANPALDPNAVYLSLPTHAGTTRTLRWTVTNGSCSSVPYEQDVTILPQVVNGSFTLSPGPYCAGALIGPLNGTTTGGGTEAYLENGNGSIVATGAGTFYQSVNSDGGLPITITYTVATAGCNNLVITRPITVNEDPFGTFDQPNPICAGSAAVQFSGVAVDGTGSFSLVSGGGSITSTGLYTPPVDGAGNDAQEVVIRFTTANPPCTPRTVDRVVQIGDDPAITGIAAVPNICVNGTTDPFNVTGTNLTNTGNVPPVTRTWRTILNTAGNYTGQGVFVGPNGGTGPDARYVSVAADAGKFVQVEYEVCQPGCGCATATDEFFVSADVIDGSFSTAPQAICVNTATAGLGAMAGPGFQGTWSVSPAAFGGTFSPSVNTPNATYTPPVGSSGTVQLVWTVEASPGPGPCGLAAFSQELVVAPIPSGTVTPTTLADICFEAGATTPILTGTVVTGFSGRWASSSPAVGGGGFVATATPNQVRYVPGPVDAGTTVQLYWITESAPCTPETLTITLNMVQPPVGVFNTPQDPICAGSETPPLNATASLGTGTWTAVEAITNVPVAGSFVDSAGGAAPNDPQARYRSDALDGGKTIELRWTVSNGICPADVNTRFVSVLNTALNGTFDTLAQTTICETDVLNLVATVGPSGSIGTWSVDPAGYGTFAQSVFNATGSATAGNTTFTPVLPANSTGLVPVNISWTVENGACSEFAITRQLNISNTPAGGFSTNLFSVCAGYSTSLLVPFVTDGTGYWSCTNCSAGSAASFLPNVNTQNAQFQSTLADAGQQVTVIWNVQSDAACATIPYSQLLQVDVPPNGDAGPAIAPVCVGELSAMLAGSGNTPIAQQVGTGQWSCVGCSGGFTSPTSNPNARFIPVQGDGGTNVALRWTLSNGECPDVSYTKNIIVDALPEGTFTTPIPTICPGDPTISLGASITTLGATGLWSTNGGGTFVDPITFLPDPTDPLARYQSVPSDDLTNVVLTWRVSNGSCDPVDYTQALPKFKLPEGGFSLFTPITICANSSTSTLPAFLGAGATGGRWFTTNGTGQFLPSPTTAGASYHSTNADAATGTIHLTWRVGNGNCISDSVDFTQSIVVSGVAVAGISTPASPSVTICQEDSLRITAVGLPGSGFSWTTSDPTRFQIESTTSSESKIIVYPNASQQFEVTISDPSGCVIVDNIVVNVIPPNPIAISATTTSICPGEALQLTLSQSPAGPLTDVVWSPTPFDVSDPLNPIVRPLANTNYLVRATTSNGCRNTASITINVAPFTNPRFDLVNRDVCGTFEDYFLTTDPTTMASCQTRTWYRNTLEEVQTGTSLNPLLSNSTAARDTVPFPITTLGRFNYVVACTDPATGCEILVEDSIWAAPTPTAGFYAYPKVQEEEEGIPPIIPRGQARLPISPIYAPDIQIVSAFRTNVTNVQAGFDSDSLSVLWYVGDTLQRGGEFISNELNPLITYGRTGKFTIFQIITELVPRGLGAPLQSCEDILIRQDYVEIREEEYVFPTAFSPNKDDMNDLFRPLPLTGQPTVEYIRIFDRWGNMIFETDRRTGWDGNDSSGRPFDPGTYTYKAKINRENRAPIFYEGAVTLIR